MRREEGTGRKNLRRANNDSFSFKGEGDVIRDKAKVNKKEKRKKTRKVSVVHTRFFVSRDEMKRREGGGGVMN